MFKLNHAHEVEQETLRPTGLGTGRAGKQFSTKDLLVVSIMGVMGGFISGLIPFSLLVKTWYPFVGGTQLVSGHHFLWMVISYGLTKKKAGILATAVVKGCIDFLLGASWGIFEVAICAYEGFFLLLAFALVERVGEGRTKLGWGIAGGLGNLSQVPFFWVLTAKIYILHISLFIMACMFAFISGVFIAGLLGKAIIERLYASGYT